MEGIYIPHSRDTLSPRVDREAVLAFIITGPTSGIGLATARALSAHGTVILVGRDTKKLEGVAAEIAQRGGTSKTIVCDLAEIEQIRRAVAEIVALQIPIMALVNNAGAVFAKPEKNSKGWDLAFATNHLGPFAFATALFPHLPDGANVLFLASGVEDGERKPAVMAGFRGGRLVSVEASARGEYKSEGGSSIPGADAYATSKQCLLAVALSLARQHERLHICAVEPGFSPGTNLGRQAPLLVRVLSKHMLTLLAPHLRYWSTPAQAAKVILRLALDEQDHSGKYFDETGSEMLCSQVARRQSFQDLVLKDTESFLANA